MATLNAMTSGSGLHRARMRGMLALTMMLCLLCSLPRRAEAQEEALSPDSVKAAFLYHFGSYVEWPPSSDPAEAITIGVIGADAVVAGLRELLPGRTINDRPVRVQSLAPGASLAGVEILFIGEGERARMRQITDAARNFPVLVVTDVPDGLERGGMINFVLANDRVRFEISRRAAENAGLKLSSRLLAVALRVQSSGLPFYQAPLAWLPLGEITRS